MEPVPRTWRRLAGQLFEQPLDGAGQALRCLESTVGDLGPQLGYPLDAQVGHVSDPGQQSTEVGYLDLVIPQARPTLGGRLGHGLALGRHLRQLKHPVDATDVIIAIGMRFDDRATGKVSGFAPHARIIHIDIDPAEIGKNVRVDVPIVGDVKTVLRELNKVIISTEHIDWVRQVDTWRREHPSTVVRDSAGLLPQYVIRQIYEVTRGEATIVTGVGQNQMWAAQHYWYNKPNSSSS